MANQKHRLLPEGLETGATCPRCGPVVKLIVCTNTKQGGQFLGCSNYPDCKYSQSIPEAMRMELEGQPQLFQTAINGGANEQNTGT